MTGHPDDLFGAVDALLEQAAPLPDPAERARLRTAGGLSRADVARALGVSTSTVTGWETGKSSPAKERRAAYGRLLEGLAQRYPAPSAPQAGSPDDDGREDVSQAVTEPEGVPGDTIEAQPSLVPEPAADAAPARTRPSPPRKAVPRRAAAAPTADGRFPHGPLGVLDGDGTVYGAGGLVLDCPAETIPKLVEWTLAASGIGAERLHRHGRDADPLLVLTAAAAQRLGLPDRLTDRKGLRLGEDHPALKEIAAADWQLTRRGFGPWTRIYRPAGGGQRHCVQLAVLPWDALDTRAWGEAATWPAAEVARVLGLYATRVLTPRGSTAVTGLELMTSLRPPTRPVRNEAGDGWTSGSVPGSLLN
ncbi:MAG: helix-turn-helix domain-containing protein, partial [Thermocrispum sp.]